MKVKRYIALIGISVFCACDPAYDINYIVDNTTDDTLTVSIIFNEIDTAAVPLEILPNSSDTLFYDFIIRDADDFDGCCPCRFKSIETPVVQTDISFPESWTVIIGDQEGSSADVVDCRFEY